MTQNPLNSTIAVPLHFPAQRLGTTTRYSLELQQFIGGSASVSGSEPIEAAIFPVQGGAALASPAIAWSDPATATALVDIFADPDILRPIVYRLSVTVAFASGPLVVVPADSFVSFLPAGSEDETFSPVREVRSGSTAYCSVGEFLRYVDRDFVGQLVRDDGGKDTVDEMAVNAILSEALQSASGEIESACSMADLYSPADLAHMSASGSNGAAFLRALTADLACARLRARRAFIGEMLPQEQRALETLDLLSRGMRIFPFDSTIRAGLPKLRFQRQDERDEVPFITDNVRYWGNRSRVYRGLF